MAKTKKYYVVWKGAKPGIYETWAECQAQIQGFPGAAYKSFESKSEAEAAYQKGTPNFKPKAGGTGRDRKSVV